MKLSDCKHGSIVKIGNNTYRLYKSEIAKVKLCEKRDSLWDDARSLFEIKLWNDTCELVDDNAAVSGDQTMYPK